MREAATRWLDGVDCFVLRCDVAAEQESAKVFVLVEFAQAPDSKFEGNKGGQ